MASRNTQEKTPWPWHTRVVTQLFTHQCHQTKGTQSHWDAHITCMVMSTEGCFHHLGLHKRLEETFVSFEILRFHKTWNKRKSYQNHLRLSGFLAFFGTSDLTHHPRWPSHPCNPRSRYWGWNYPPHGRSLRNAPRMAPSTRVVVPYQPAVLPRTNVGCHAQGSSAHTPEAWVFSWQKGNHTLDAEIWLYIYIHTHTHLGWVANPLENLIKLQLFTNPESGTELDHQAYHFPDFPADPGHKDFETLATHPKV